MTSLYAQQKPDLQIAGIDGDALANVSASLGLAGEPCDAPRWRVRKRFQRADEQIANALRAIGYYQVEVVKTLEFTTECWQASLTIVPGEPTRITELDIQVEDSQAMRPEIAKILALSKIQIGGILHHGHYEDLKRLLLERANELGFLDARLQHRRLLIDPAAYTARIELTLGLGPRYHFGAVLIDAPEYTRELVERFVAIQPGSVYDALAIASTIGKLSDSGYFDQVEVVPQRDLASDHAIPVHIKLTARPRHAYRVSAGISTDTGPRLATGYQNRRINRFGHRLGSELSLSLVINEFAADYGIPLFNLPWRELSLAARYKTEDTGILYSEQYTPSINLTGKRGDWNETISLDLLKENSQISGTRQDSILLIPGVEWNRTRTKDLIRPRDGDRLQFDLRAAQEGFLADASFVQLHAQGKWITPLGDGSMIMRSELGTTLTQQFAQLPASLRFFAGGDQSVRGYDFHAIGPRDATGVVLGGQHLIVGSLEYEHPVRDDWAAAIFTDAGNAFEAVNDGLKTSIGVGARWYSPVGPIRLDLAFPSDRRDDDFRIHFSFGSLL